jgi:hypothetical protein
MKHLNGGFFRAVFGSAILLLGCNTPIPTVSPRDGGTVSAVDSDVVLWDHGSTEVRFVDLDSMPDVSLDDVSGHFQDASFDDVYDAQADILLDVAPASDSRQTDVATELVEDVPASDTTLDRIGADVRHDGTDTRDAATDLTADQMSDTANDAPRCTSYDFGWRSCTTCDVAGALLVIACSSVAPRTCYRYSNTCIDSEFIWCTSGEYARHPGLAEECRAFCSRLGDAGPSSTPCVVP